jgi:anti-sigma B factor antagonist
VDFDDFHPTYFTLDDNGDVTVASFTKLSLSDEENVEQLAHELFSLVEQYNRRKVVLDMHCVEYVTSSILGKMITLHRKLHRTNGRLVVCGLTEGVQRILSSSRLIEYFETSTDVDNAVAMLNSQAAGAV